MFVGVLVLATCAAAANWPQWRGPEGNGVSPETGLPTEWSQTRNVRWKTPIPGRGHSSPVIWGNRVFLTTALEGSLVPGAKAVKHIVKGEEFVHPAAVGADRQHTLKVLALDRETGRIVWEKTAYQGTVYDDRHRKNTYASPTPVTDGRHVYAYFGPEGLYSYDFDGRLIWKTSLGDIATLGLGAGTSLVLYENLVIVQSDQERDGANSFIVAVDKRTGGQVWRTPRSEPVSWATPLVVRHAGRPELIASGAHTVISYDPATGKELWRSAGVEMNAVPTPVSGHGMVFVLAKQVFAIRLGGNGNLTGTPHIVWNLRKGSGPVPSPVLYRDYLYVLTNKGILSCFDARTGEVMYNNGRVPVPATFIASLLAFEGKVLLTSEDGDTFVVKAGPKFEVLGTNSIGEPVYASPAVSDGKIFIRGEKTLYCIQKQAAR